MVSGTSIPAHSLASTSSMHTTIGNGSHEQWFCPYWGSASAWQSLWAYKWTKPWSIGPLLLRWVQSTPLSASSTQRKLCGSFWLGTIWRFSHSMCGEHGSVFLPICVSINSIINKIQWKKLLAVIDSMQRHPSVTLIKFSSALFILPQISDQNHFFLCNFLPCQLHHFLPLCALEDGQVLSQHGLQPAQCFHLGPHHHHQGRL